MYVSFIHQKPPTVGEFSDSSTNVDIPVKETSVDTPMRDKQHAMEEPPHRQGGKQHTPNDRDESNTDGLQITDADQKNRRG